MTLQHEHRQLEGQESLFEEDPHDRSVDEVGGDLLSSLTSSTHSSRSERQFVTGQAEDFDDEVTVSGMENHFKQLELEFPNFPTADQAHEDFIAKEINGLALSVMSEMNYSGQDFEDLMQDLMVEGVKAVHAWTPERKMTLNEYVRYRMKMKRQRLIANMTQTALTSSVSIHKRELFYQLKNDPDLTPEEAFLEWVRLGNDEHTWQWLETDLTYPDEADKNEGAASWEQTISFTFSHLSDPIFQELDGMVWERLFPNGEVPLWASELDDDDMLVLNEIASDPDASNREIGRILGHDHKWVKKRKDRIAEAMKGWVVENEIK
jgi:hypothetical protein